MNNLPSVEQSYGVELIRKSIHLCSLSIPVVYYFITKPTALAILIPLTLAFLFFDIARFRHAFLGTFFYTWFGWLLRTRERDHKQQRLNGATYVLLSATLGILVFPKVIFITAFAILIVSDTFAALVGRKFGRHTFLNKTREGTAAFIITALVVVACTPKISHQPEEYALGFTGALLGSIVEALPLAIDDNLSIPLVIGTAMWLLYAVLLPDINVFALDALR